MDVGLIGLLQMGTGMAANLLKAGHRVTVYNRTRAKAETLVAQGARAAADIAGACRSEAVITMLANDEAVNDVVLRHGGALDNLATGALHISSSTISVGLSQRLSHEHAKVGQRYIAAQVFGRPDFAAAGRLFVVVGGEPNAVEGASHLFEAMGQRTFVVSDTPAAANLVRLSGNFLGAAVIESLGEALAFTAKGGVDRHQYLEILTSSGGERLDWSAIGGLPALDAGISATGSQFVNTH